MHITRPRSFRCYYRRPIPGQQPLEFFIQLRARNADAAGQIAHAVIGFPVHRVVPTPTVQEA